MKKFNFKLVIMIVVIILVGFVIMKDANADVESKSESTYFNMAK